MEHDPESSQKLNELLKKVNIAMLTTINEDGSLCSRPMGTQQKETNGDLWFFTSKDTDKVREIQHDPRVNVSYSEMGKSIWLSISGEASIVEDKTEIERQWSPELKAWFPEGIDTPGICLIKVSASSAEYWDNPSSKVVMLYGLAKAALTGEKEDLGENKEIEL